MVMNIIEYKGIDSTTYKTTNDTKKFTINNNQNSDSVKNQEVSQHLGNDTFIKSTDKVNTN